jgi:hypothetical protein
VKTERTDTKVQKAQVDTTLITNCFWHVNPTTLTFLTENLENGGVDDFAVCGRGGGGQRDRPGVLPYYCIYGAGG